MQTVEHHAGIEDEVKDTEFDAVDRKELVDVPDDSPGVVSMLLGRITDDLKALGRDELALARAEINQKVKSTLLDTMVILLSGAIATVALAFLMFAAIDAAEPILAPLWARLLIGGALYTLIGAGLLYAYARKLKRDMAPSAPRAAKQARRTAQAVKEELGNA
jgi:hypothetical protein